MFTLNIYLKLAIIAVSLVFGILSMVLWGFWYGFPFLLIGLVMLASYLFLGTVQSAAQLMETTDFAGAERRLALTLKPNWLYKTNRSYYYMIKGTIATHLKDQVAAEKWFTMSKEAGLPSDNERAMVALHLANLAAAKGKWKEAMNHFRPTKNYKVSEPQLREQLKQFEKALTNRGQMKHHRHFGASKKAKRFKRM